jgi:hypothetical protein
MAIRLAAHIVERMGAMWTMLHIAVVPTTYRHFAEVRAAGGLSCGIPASAADARFKNSAAQKSLGESGTQRALHLWRAQVQGVLCGAATGALSVHQWSAWVLLLLMFLHWKQTAPRSGAD